MPRIFYKGGASSGSGGKLAEYHGNLGQAAQDIAEQFNETGYFDREKLESIIYEAERQGIEVTYSNLAIDYNGMVYPLTGFKDGATPKDIHPEMTYEVTKVSNSKSADYGALPGSDVKQMLKGYKFNGLFWSKPKTSGFYEVRPVIKRY